MYSLPDAAGFEQTQAQVRLSRTLNTSFLRCLSLFATRSSIPCHRQFIAVFHGSSGNLPEFEGFPNLTISPDSKVAMITAIASPASEQYGRLGGRLEHWEGGNLRTVIVSGSRGGEGATVTATNLSLALAKDPTRKVLLVDANIGHPGISALLGFSNKVQGLSQFLADDVPITGVVYRTEISNFCVTPSGAVLASEGEPLTAKIGDFLDQVSERFDWVVIDSPAVSCASFEVLQRLR